MVVADKRSLAALVLTTLGVLATPLGQQHQEPFLLEAPEPVHAIGGHAAHVARIDYAALSTSSHARGSRQLADVHPLLRFDNVDDDNDDVGEVETEFLKPPMKGMELVKLHASGKKKDRVNLMFLADGYTKDEKQKFIDDARKLTAVVVSQDEAMSHVADLLNIWGVFIPSKESGIGTHDQPIRGNPFGLYRPGPELRGVYVAKPSKARAVCKWWNKQHGEGGCDSAILLGNDGLYGGLGGEFTVITASEQNGPLVLRHELGHTLIEEGDEYDGSFAYDGANAAKVDSIQKGIIKWDKFLSDPDNLRIEDSTMPLQDYPWQNLTETPYKISFTSTSTAERKYPTAMIRTSISGLSAADQLSFTLNDQPVDLSSGFPDVDGWRGSKDRRWIEAHVNEDQLKDGENIIKVHLTDAGREQDEPQGGKMITSVEVIQYGESHLFNNTEGFVGAFPTFDDHKRMTLRPTSENCLMRRVQHKTFCPVCAAALREKLENRIKHRK